jgi:hypothetical protein
LVSASIAWNCFSARDARRDLLGRPITFKHALAERDGDLVGVERALGREQPVAALVLLADDHRRLRVP